MPDAIVVIDTSATIRWANPSAQELFGLTLDEVVGTSGLALIHPEDVDLAASSALGMGAKERGSLIEVRIRTPEGWCLIELVGRRDGDDIVLSLRDLTQRRRWEVSNDDSARLRSILQNAAALMLLVDHEGVVTDSSGAVTRLLGYDQEWIEGRPLRDLVAPRDQRTLEALLDRIRSGGAAHRDRRHAVDLDLFNAAGWRVPFALTLVDLLDDPTVGALVLTGHDITDRHRVEADLRRANSMLAATLDSTADGIVAVDLHGHVTGMNDRMREMLQLEPWDQASSSHARLLDHIASQLVEPEGHVRSTEELTADPSAITQEDLDFADGRVLERRSRPQVLDGEVIGRVWSYRDITSEEHLARELAHQALHDPLTGLPNRVLLKDRVEQALVRLRRVGGRLGVLFIDLDDFKTVNDSLGHAAGDQLLVEVARRIEGCVRSGDTVARLGGDEFAVLIDGVEDDVQAADVAHRIVQSLQLPVSVHGRDVVATASLGLAIGVRGDDADELLRNADLAMYTAKRGGRNCVSAYEPDMHRVALERLEIEAELRRAIERREFVVHYQPIVELATRRILGFEALVRWQHPERGLLHPVDFIGIAEAGEHLLDGIAHQVLGDACAQLARWRSEERHHQLTVAVNISPGQLLDPTFPDLVQQTLAEHGIPTSCLAIELTEGALIRDPDTVALRLQRLHRAGITIAVDDFGTGYSSLAYLQRFAIDVIKIDQSFVAETLSQPDLNLAGAIIGIADTLGLATVAEGIESDAQVAALLALGCERGQGYHLGVPMTGEEATALLTGIRSDADGSNATGSAVISPASGRPGYSTTAS